MNANYSFFKIAAINFYVFVKWNFNCQILLRLLFMTWHTVEKFFLYGWMSGASVYLNLV